MATQTAVLHTPSKSQIARAIAGGLPSELSQRPLVGILGVVLGAGIVTLAGRMLTLGTADLKGALGIGYDDGAWIGSAFNIALMFIGPFTVYLGGLLGARKVLMLAATSFTVICAFLPLIHSYSLLTVSYTHLDVYKRQELRRSEFYLTQGQSLAHTGSFAFDPDGFFSHWSEELFEIYGLERVKGGPTLAGYLATIHPEDREFMSNLIENMLREGLGCDVIKRIVRPDGEVRYIRCVSVPVLENGALRNILGTAMDITEQEKLAQELRRREMYLAEAQTLSHTGSFGWNLRLSLIHI